jgi:peptide/nickel transport system substrate-binding protein
VAAFIKPDILAVSALPSDSEGRHIANVVHAGLAQEDDAGRLHPQLGEAVPTVENNFWKLFPDGRMETTWRIKPNARWHDGTPVTPGDLLFGLRIQQDRELGFRPTGGFEFLEGVETPDNRTIVGRWKGPYIEADSFLAASERWLPRHILEQPYTENKAQFMEQPFWTDGFVGAGPFKLKEYARGSHVLFEAFDDYILGRAKVDEIEIRFINDASTMIANVLAGAVHTTLGLSVAPDQAAQVKEQWRDGMVVTSPYHGSTVATFPQMLDPALPVVKDVRFRRAMLHAIDRQEMVETIMLGQSAISHTLVPPLRPEFEGIQSAIVRYDYDLRKTAQLLEELGYRKGQSGLYEDAAGQRLAFEHWGIQEEQERVRSTLVVADFWRKAGLDVEPFIVPAQQGRDREYTAKFPVFMVRGVPGSYSVFSSFFHSASAPTAENRYQGNNRARYMNPELDALLDRFYATIPPQERTQALRAVVRHLSDEAIWMGLFYAVYNTLISNRVKNRTPDSNRSKAYNSHLWDVT